MRLNWGSGIAVFYIAFLVITVALVGWSFTEDVNLVTDDYYEKELLYQSEIDKLQNLADLSVKPEVKQNGDLIEIAFPTELTQEKLQGEIHLYRPSDHRFDIRVPLSLVQSKQVIPINSLVKGLWEIKIDWVSGSTAYLQKNRIILK